MNFNRILFLGLIQILLFRCETNSSSLPKEANIDTTPSSISRTTEVAIQVIDRQSFSQEILSQGTIQAENKSDVTFDLQNRIEEIFITTGQTVKKNQPLARLQNFELKNNLEKLEAQISKANINFEAKLISLGYSTSDTLDIPQAVLNTARIESNLPELLIEKALAEYKLKQTVIYAPINGIVAVVEAQVGNLTSDYEKLCTIIDNNNLEAVFPILEREFSLIALQQDVIIEPLNGFGKYKAKISKITPQVGENGMINTFASITKKDGRLLDGMNIKVVIKKNIPNQLIVPKSSVVDRQGRQVVFSYRKGKAHWNYVKLGLENQSGYVVEEGLSAGDTIITNNNFNLSHLEKVKISGQ